jgi:hypothetical protein
MQLIALAERLDELWLARFGMAKVYSGRPKTLLWNLWLLPTSLTPQIEETSPCPHKISRISEPINVSEPQNPPFFFN